MNTTDMKVIAIHESNFPTIAEIYELNCSSNNEKEWHVMASINNGPIKKYKIYCNKGGMWYWWFNWKGQRFWIRDILDQIYKN